jgi:acrylyl-CoA reductase (NADPH)
MSYQALVTRRREDGRVSSSVETRNDDRLPAGNVTVDVEWAGLNYKDGLYLTGAGARTPVSPCCRHWLVPLPKGCRRAM